MKISLLNNLSSWMETIPATNSLAQMSIPGTNYSYLNDSNRVLIGGYTFHATQYASATIEQQLKDGIRYFELGCNFKGGDTIALDLYYREHNILSSSLKNQGGLDRILKEFITFLSEHPSETILVNIWKETGLEEADSFVEIFKDTYVKRYRQHMYLEHTVPLLKDVRGKIVIIAGYGMDKFNMPGIHSVVLDSISDPRSTTVFNDHISEAVEANSINKKNKLYLYVAGFKKLPDTTDHKRQASLHVPKLTYELQSSKTATNLVNNKINQTPYIGIISMDYYTNNLVTEVIKRNDNKDISGYPIVTLYNPTYEGHYLYASGFITNNRREVYCWEPGNLVREAYWVKIPYQNDKYYLFNTFYREFLYASALVKDNRRYLYTCGDGTEYKEGLWEIKKHNDTYTIYNEYYTCYLYESGITSKENRRFTPCWAPGNRVQQDNWIIK